MPEVLSDDWQLRPFASLCLRLVNGGTPDTNNSAYWNGNIPWITGADFALHGIGEIRRYLTDAGIRSCATSLVKAGNLLVVTRTGVGKLAIAPFDVAISQDITGVYVNGDEADACFTFYLLSRELSQLKKLNQGTSINGIIRTDLERHKVLIPKSTLLQKKIAEILSSLDTAIEKTEALIEKYQQIKAGLMNDLFSRGLLPNGQLRPPREQAPELYQETKVGWIPLDWDPRPLTEYLDPVAGVKPGPFGSSLTKDSYTSAGFRVYGQEQVISGDLTIGDYYVSREKFSEMRAFEVLSGDVLLSLVGTVGCVLVVDPPFEPGIINPRLVRLRPAEKRVLPHFLRYLLITNAVRRQIENLSGGGTMPVINGKVIRRIVVPFLSMGEQELIVERLNAMEKELFSLERQLGKLRFQKNGLMQDLLTGKVEVRVSSGDTTRKAA